MFLSGRCDSEAKSIQTHQNDNDRWKVKRFDPTANECEKLQVVTESVSSSSSSSESDAEERCDDVVDEAQRQRDEEQMKSKTIHLSNTWERMWTVSAV